MGFPLKGRVFSGGPWAQPAESLHSGIPSHGTFQRPAYGVDNPAQTRLPWNLRR